MSEDAEVERGRFSFGAAQDIRRVGRLLDAPENGGETILDGGDLRHFTLTRGPVVAQRAHEDGPLVRLSPLSEARWTTCPSAVRTFPAHIRSRWMSAAWHAQQTTCCSAAIGIGSGSRSSSVIWPVVDRLK